MAEYTALFERAAARFAEPRLSTEGLRRRRARKDRNRRIRAGALALVVAVVGAGVLVRAFSPGHPAVADARERFLGVWISTSDADGGTQTMTVSASGDGGVAIEIVVTDDVATVCSGTPSTMTGTGRIGDGTALVVPSPTYTCDDGSEPEVLSGPPLQEQLRDWMLVLDPGTETLSDGFGGIWVREDAEVPSPEQLSGGMWPQTSLEEVRQAQERADAGDPRYTWQIDARLFTDDTWTIEEPGQIELVDRFLRDVLGWEAYVLNLQEGMGRNGVYDVNFDQRYLRCAPVGTNPLYPPDPEPDLPVWQHWGELCAPTLDDLRYESVSLDLAQPFREASDGIWVVNRWRLTEPFAQADPAVVEAEARERLEEFLAARIVGTGAEGLVQVDSAVVPLLYATTSGAPYERYEIERVDGPQWPSGNLTFSARLFADGDATVVEQEVAWWQHDPTEVLWLDANSTTENGQPTTLSYASGDGEVTASTPSNWRAYWPGKDADAADVWFGLLWRDSATWDSSEHIGLVDPVAYDSWCAENGGSPLLSAPADAAAIAQEVIADPNFETTAPVAARVGGLDAVSIDVALAPGGEACGIGMIEIARWIHTIGWDPTLRLRLYLVDLPEDMSVETLAITVVAPEERFEEFIEETAPIIDSIEFHAP